MSDLSKRLWEFTGPLGTWESKNPSIPNNLIREAAEALDAKDAEIERLEKVEAAAVNAINAAEPLIEEYQKVLPRLEAVTDAARELHDFFLKTVGDDGPVEIIADELYAQVVRDRLSTLQKALKELDDG